ncbi:hypothetical protein AQZ52_07125 [Novosphingobium fuchskuhlense]|uniref:Peptidyl-prolyl cis-trans isomerase n=1 Tax=Novosphingobium fuchskuhlense TaxID=1117702 RepID=A0A124JW48_9SPHN|nr:FKBP-type peptidyl-prolyl cis-trans isomerase [Novosphingobium fuchskuhlense]KUR72965.1 hypothetical protein AQZ52_07125 [Novosphingobium fuchskuhlense]
MSIQHSGLRRIALSASLAALVALPVQVQAQAAAPAPAPAAARAADILPVPLNPVVPADKRQCSVKEASGIGTLVLREAAGPKPSAGDFILVNYIGYLAADGTVFDQNVQQAFSTGAVIKGFAEGLLKMNQGSIWRICIPAALGYGEKGAGPIPPNSDIVFQVELLDFKTQAQVAAMRAEAEKQAAAPQAAAPQGDAAAAKPAADKPAAGKPKK